MRKIEFVRTAAWAFAILVVVGTAPIQAAPIVVTDATNVFGTDAGAVYRIPDAGAVVTIASGGPLKSPSGLLFNRADANGDEYFVSDIGLFYGLNDGGVFLAGDNRATVTVWSGAPLSSPFGLLRIKNMLYVADFGSPFSTYIDGAIYELNLDPDGDKVVGPFPLPATALRTVHLGAPLSGVNQMVLLKGKTALVADDSGSLYEVDLSSAKPPVAFGPPFADPVGLCRLGKDFVVVDALSQEVYLLGEKGVDLTLLLAGSFLDQFLGCAIEGDGSILVANAGQLSTSTDGQIIRIQPNSVTVAYSGAPLKNPFAPAAPRSGKSKN